MRIKSVSGNGGGSSLRTLIAELNNQIIANFVFEQHEELCRVPSGLFYEGKLKTAEEVLNREPDNVKWPNGNSHPFVFHHVEGKEESLVVTTNQGNENSKKNKKEIAKVVSVFLGKLIVIFPIIIFTDHNYLWKGGGGEAQ